MFDFDKNILEKYIRKLSEPRILIIGDLAIDEMVYGDTERISREAPVIILRHSNTKIILGQAANADHKHQDAGEHRSLIRPNRHQNAEKGDTTPEPHGPFVHLHRMGLPFRTRKGAA